ncbi:hypothetical protein NMF86_10270 [Clostridioides difficile]|uniref:hypothetical protein n=1 Tax=Clostridioides difficile TaxID=1496 RepID=UPI001441D81C|nr:hypothetical protein [Clostridioides difficile]MCP8343876.1 hypothetical protein [Clostridioides difficile]MCP8393909.1 hypothetical protein [Clostridioides difficile]NKN23638.1 hypothetical protein [Clostridioides difficile]
MKKRIAFIIVTVCVLLIAGCGDSNSAEDSVGTDRQMAENVGQKDTEGNIATDGVADYPTAIMVNDTVYLVEGNPMPEEVDENAIIGYTESYTDTFPENNGETNFNPELGMPYAQVEGGIAVLYKNEWYLGTPLSNENAITFTGTSIDPAVDSDIKAEELADRFGITVSLPENTNWITDREYCLVDENNLKITYHDTVADADCTLLVAKNENLNLPDNEYDEALNESWEGDTIGSQHIVVKVQHENNDGKMVLATWEYNEYQFAIIGEDENDSKSIPKVALHIIYNLN